MEIKNTNKLAQWFQPHAGIWIKTIYKLLKMEI
jgi:hypothetical protein